MGRLIGETFLQHIQSWPLKCAQPIKPKITPKKEEFAPGAYNKNVRQAVALLQA